MYRELMVSPFNTRRKLNALIDGEIKRAKSGDEAYIYLNMRLLRPGLRSMH